MSIKTAGYIILFNTIALCLCACNAGTTSSEVALTDTKQDFGHSRKTVSHFDKSLVKNTFLRIQNFIADSNQSYQLYLPSDYDTLKSFPLLLFFDAHARGNLPLKKYKSLADKFHFVFAGSNSIQNGMSPPEAQQRANELLKDLIERVNINPQLIFVSGFSGGAKVACTFAFTNSAIRGVIACAAPFTEQLNAVANHPELFLIAGNQDFNMLGIVQADLNLSNAGFNHQLYVVDGKHEWPDEKFFDRALLWLQLQAEKNGLTGKTYLTNELPDFNDWYKSRVTDAIILKQENEEQNEMKQQFVNGDLSYWNKIISSLNEKKISGYPSSIRYLAIRELNFISMMGYVYTEAALNEHNLPAAAHYLKIYESVDPINPDVWYLKAIYSALAGDQNESVSLLSKAAKLGFADIDKLKDEKIFSSFQHSKKFQDLVYNPVLLNSEKF